MRQSGLFLNGFYSILQVLCCLLFSQYLLGTEKDESVNVRRQMIRSFDAESNSRTIKNGKCKRANLEIQRINYSFSPLYKPWGFRPCSLWAPIVLCDF